MCISTIRVIRPVNEAPMKEFLKEFFRLVGCLYCDKPVHSSAEVREALTNTKDLAEVNIVLNISPNAVGLSEQRYFSSKTQLETKRYQLCRLERQDRHEKNIFLEYIIPEKYDDLFYYHLIAELIDLIWDNKLERQDLKMICSYYLYYDIFGYAQSKRTFKISRMGEVLDLAGVRDFLIPYSNEPQRDVKNYLTSLVSAFDQLYRRLNAEELLPLKLHSTYWKYARINAARKVQELLNTLYLDWDEIEKKDNQDKQMFSAARGYCDTAKLLSEAIELYKEDEGYLGILFLATRLCQSDPKQKSNTGYYFNWLFEQLEKNKERSSAYSFAYYWFGSYLEKISDILETHKGQELAYYQMALDLDRLNYHAAFKIGCYYNKIGELEEARRYFSLVHFLVMTEFYGTEQDASDPYVAVKPGWENITLKSLQYLFKASVAEYKIYKKQGFDEGADNCLRNMDLIIDQYRENLCVSKIYDSNSPQWDTLKKYHQVCHPHRLLKCVKKEIRNIIVERKVRNSIK